ncbi:MAG: hypothetical protein HRT90_06365 [Candidatus Margulisbacteria bacterium]|nr:hypothetical protein [Candidatus Margulisiibacteriota bacterium]
MLGLVDKYKRKPGIKLKDVLSEFSEPYKDKGFCLDSHSFLNQYQFISSLYAMIVLPKQKYFNELPNIKIGALVPGWGLNFKNSESNYDFKEFLRRMRNSVAHGHIEFTEQLIFSFSDKKPGAKESDFSVKLTEQQIRLFTRALAYWCLKKDINLSGL